MAQYELARLPEDASVQDCLRAMAKACDSIDKVLGVAPPDSVAENLRVVLDSAAPVGGYRFSVSSDGTNALSCDLPEGFIVCSAAGPSGNLGGSRLAVTLQDLAAPFEALQGASFVYELAPAP